MDAFFLLRSFGPVLGLVTLMMAALIVAPALLYVIARWRAHREPFPDTQLGLKFAFHYFAISAFQLALAGGALLVYMLISPGSDKGTGYRTAFGLILPAGIVLALHLSMLQRTNDRALPGVRRLFLGYNFLVTGIVAFFALVLGFQALLQKGSAHGLGHLAGAMIVVYGGAWVAIGYQLAQLVLGDSFGAGGPPQEIVTPVVPTPSAPGEGGLPALGGGWPAGARGRSVSADRPEPLIDARRPRAIVRSSPHEERRGPRYGTSW